MRPPARLDENTVETENIKLPRVYTIGNRESPLYPRLCRLNITSRSGGVACLDLLWEVFMDIIRVVDGIGTLRSRMNSFPKRGSPDAGVLVRDLTACRRRLVKLVNQNF